MIYLRDYVTIRNRAIKYSDAKAFETAILAEYTCIGIVDISFADVHYVVTNFARNSIGSFLYYWDSSSFAVRAQLANRLIFHDYQSDAQKFVINECIRVATDEEYHDRLKEAWENEDRYSIYDND